MRFNTFIPLMKVPSVVNQRVSINKVRRILLQKCKHKQLPYDFCILYLFFFPFSNVPFGLFVCFKLSQPLLVISTGLGSEDRSPDQVCKSPQHSWHECITPGLPGLISQDHLNPPQNAPIDSGIPEAFRESGVIVLNACCSSKSLREL